MSKSGWIKQLSNGVAIPRVRELSYCVGRARTDIYLSLLYEMLKKTGNLEAPPDTVADMIRLETTRTRNRSTYIDGLLQQAKSGQLRANMAVQGIQDVVPPDQVPSGDGTVPVIHAAGGKAREREKALFWICHHALDESKLKELGKVKAILKEYIPDDGSASKTGAALGITSAWVKKIHKAVVPNPNLGGALFKVGGEWHRITTQPTPYPSSVGGMFCLDHAFLLTSNKKWPANEDPHWMDAALFYLGAIGAAQAFGDGNKRVAHIAYAIVLINGGLWFRAPTEAYEGQLFNM